MHVVPLASGIASDDFEHRGSRLIVMVILTATAHNHSVANTLNVNTAKLRRVSTRSHCVMFLAEVCSFVVVLCSAT